MPPPFRVEIQPSSRDWPAIAQAEALKLQAALGTLLLAVHHIGSTAVPGLAAKPVIDLMPVVSDLALLDHSRAALEGVGCQWWGELGITGRRYCTRDSASGARLVQLHCFQDGSPHIQRHLAFRDFLRAHPARAAAYEAEKRRCASVHPDNSHAYSDCKAGWIAAVEAEALEWDRVRSGRV